MHAYLSGQPCEESQLSMLACFLVYHSVPAPQHLPSIGLEGNCTWVLFSHLHSPQWVSFLGRRNLYCVIFSDFWLYSCVGVIVDSFFPENKTKRL